MPSENYKMKPKLVVGLLSGPFGWAGGVELLRNLTNGLLAKRNEQPLEIWLLLPFDNKIESVKDVARIVKRTVVQSINKRQVYIPKELPAYHSSTLDFFSHLNGEIKLLEYANTHEGLIRALKKIRANVIFPYVGMVGANNTIPGISYLADFQHRYLPDNFSVEECFNRDISFAETLKNAKAVIVNSHAVKSDIQKFFPNVNSRYLTYRSRQIQCWSGSCHIRWM